MDTRTLSATITHTHNSITYIIDGPVPTVPDEDAAPEGIEDSPTAEDRARLAAWCTALAHDVPGIPDDADWGHDVTVTYGAWPADTPWDDIWSMALAADAQGFEGGTVREEYS